MEKKEERLIKEIKQIYTVIVKKMIDSTFQFPGGGAVNRQLSTFITEFTKLCGGNYNASRMVDYCVFQTHKNRLASFQKNLASKAFGQTALKKYNEMSSKEKKYMEDKWLSEANLSRSSLNSLICKKEHPLAKYIYMQSEEGTKKRNVSTDVGFLICSTSTLMWSPFSPTCELCKNVDKCKIETEKRYPELYRIRMEKYGER